MTENKWIITDEQLEQARHNYAIPREMRKQIFLDRETEEQAARTVTRTGETVKAVVNHLVMDLNCTNLVQAPGGRYYISNADKQSRYQIDKAYVPYMKMVIRRLYDPFMVK